MKYDGDAVWHAPMMRDGLTTEAELDGWVWANSYLCSVPLTHGAITYIAGQPFARTYPPQGMRCS